jgi:L-fuconate dehydratase
MLSTGYPAYTTSAGWLGYPDDKVRKLVHEGLAQGWTHFKMKVGRNLQDDLRRARIIREEIGWDRKLMMDANQVWDVSEAVRCMKELAEFRPHWIEEPTSPDDVLGHARIAEAIAPIGVPRASAESVMFKQLPRREQLVSCQIDSCRLGGVNEVLACCCWPTIECPSAACWRRRPVQYVRTSLLTTSR